MSRLFLTKMMGATKRSVVTAAVFIFPTFFSCNLFWKPVCGSVLFSKLNRPISSGMNRETLVQRTLAKAVTW